MLNVTNLNFTDTPTCCGTCTGGTTNITEYTSYVVYLTADDLETIPNLMPGAPTVLYVTTLDVTPPTFLPLPYAVGGALAAAVTPALSANVKTSYAYAPNAGGVTLNISVVLSSPGRVYFMAQPTAGLVNPPTSALTLRSHVGRALLAVPSAGVPVSATLSGLAAATAYTVFIAAEDLADGNTLGGQYIDPTYLNGTHQKANLQVGRGWAAGL